jgi:hypothetical protein
MPCWHYVQNQTHRFKKFQSNIEPLDAVRMDICRPIKPSTLAGNLYLHSIVYYGSNFASIHPIQYEDAEIISKNLNDFFWR